MKKSKKWNVLWACGLVFFGMAIGEAWVYQGGSWILASVYAMIGLPMVVVAYPRLNKKDDNDNE